MISAARIALEALRAGIPARDDAGWVQHVDGVVRHRLDQEAIAAVLRQRRSVEALGLLHFPPNTRRQYTKPECQCGQAGKVPGLVAVQRLRQPQCDLWNKNSRMISTSGAIRNGTMPR